MDLGQGDGVDTSHAEGQPAATLDADAQNPTAPTRDPLSSSEGRGASARRRSKKGRRRARRVKPVEPQARAEVAAAALAERLPDEDPNGGGTAATEGPDGEATPPGPADFPGGEPVAVVDPADAIPVIRLAFKGAALAFRRAKRLHVARSLWETADRRAAQLADTLGVRVLGAVATRAPFLLAALPIVAELLEPFAEDAWDGGKSRPAPSPQGDA